MKKIMIGILVSIFLITVAVFPATGIEIPIKKDGNYSNELLEIENTENKFLTVDEVIGDKHVKYWEHNIDGVTIKNDSILLHTDIESGDISNLEKSWTDVNFEIKEFNDIVIHDEYLWKKKVVFTDNDDLMNFYQFDSSVEYPIFCWEVRHTDGTTIMYGLDGSKIGNGIPTPVEGYSLAGYNDDPLNPNPWILHRSNADYWFKKWCDITTTDTFPTPAIISTYVSNPDVEYFYELAHGGSHYFVATNTIPSLYRDLDVMVDMEFRQPMRFAFIGSCEGMDYTGYGSFSDAFRKGQMTGTVTVGFDNMGGSSGWDYEWFWQNVMFSKMNEGLTIYDAFIFASQKYPIVAPNVVFVGDQNLKIHLPPDTPKKPVGDLKGVVGIKYTYTTDTADPNGDDIYYWFDWGDGTNSGWVGPFSSGQTGDASKIWTTQGTRTVKVKAKDTTGKESGWAQITVVMPKGRVNERPILRFLENHPRVFHTLRQLLGL